jgi:CO/xanthine dehydrogenase Mo-binding subunit
MRAIASRTIRRSRGVRFAGRRWPWWSPSRYLAGTPPRRSTSAGALDVVGDTEAALADGSPLMHEGREAATSSRGRSPRAMRMLRWPRHGPLVGDPSASTPRRRRHREFARAWRKRDASAEMLPSGSTQVPGLLRDLLAGLLGLPGHRVGGGAGRGRGSASERSIPGRSSSAPRPAARRPIKWVGDRREDLLTSHRRGTGHPPSWVAGRDHRRRARGWWPTSAPYSIYP